MTTSIHSADRDSTTFRRYLGWFIAALIVALAMVAIFNLWANPYRLFDVFGESRWNSVKARPESNIASIKLLNAIDARPTAVIIGNSRADIGFRPDHPAWSQHRGHVYNLAVPGVGIQHVRDDFRALLVYDNPEIVLLAVDFQDFVLNAERVGSRSGQPSINTETLRRRERLRALFTLTGLGDSLRTIAASRTPFAATLRSDGFNPLRDYLLIAARDGYHAMFRQRLNETTANFSRARRGILPPGDSDSEEFAALRDILRMARERGVELHVVTYPYHSQYYLMYADLGIWPEFERWKRMLLRTVDDARVAGDGDWKVTLWDFAAISELTTLDVENSADSGAGHWYWEAGHFKTALGDLVLERALNTDKTAVPDFGTELTSTNIDGWLTSQAAALQQHSQDQPAQVTEVRAAVARAREKAAELKAGARF